MTLCPVVMAGGSGTRFWPLSRTRRPKQFLPLTSDRPLIVETIQRLKGLATPKNMYVVCGPVHEKEVRRLLKTLPKQNILIEPMARNTAPAIALAAVHVASKDSEAVLLILPSDHHIADVPGFRKALQDAAEIAARGHLVTLGIRPSRPDTGYGYIHIGDPMDGDARQVRAFVEKPNLETAERYLTSGDYFWNAGIFLFRADAILDGFRQHMPEMTKGLSALQEAIGTRLYGKTLERVFPKLPATSIDYGVMEKAKNLVVLPVEFGWSDVGSFAALPDVRKADEKGNVMGSRDALLVDCEGCVVLPKDKPIAVIGMKDVVVVDAGDALLVVPKDKSQDVRKAVEVLRARKQTALL